VIRPATPADASTIAEIQVRSWHRAYGDTLPPDLAPELADSKRRWTQHITVAPDVRVFDVAGQVAGVISFGPGEILTLLVDPPAQGAGVGTTLLTDALDTLRARGFTEATLQVEADNAHARHFYEARGWAPVGDLRYRRAL
jgi:ribosomal protein S18 acetylase RimI-like enzyme